MTEEKQKPNIKACSQACMDNGVSCDFSDCPSWINYKEDNNCDLIAIHKNGQMTLREVGERMGVSYVRVKQIEEGAIKKIKNSIALEPAWD